MKRAIAMTLVLFLLSLGGFTAVTAWPGGTNPWPGGCT